MAPSVQDGRVSKTRCLPSRNASQPLRKDRKTNHGDSSSKSKQIGRVERTNALKLEDFITAHVPSESLVIEQKFDSETPIAQEPTTGDRSKQSKYALEIYSAHSIPEPVLESCFNLIEETSLAAYESSSIGWSASNKRKEMRLPDMRYIVLRKRVSAKADFSPPLHNGSPRNHYAPDHIPGFLSFMVTYEDGKEVIYCYEIHLSSEIQGQGLGRQLITVFEQIGQNVGLEKAMLTVFVSNTQALRFYENLGYTVDAYSPEPRKLRNGTIKEPDYRILSKVLR